MNGDLIQIPKKPELILPGAGGIEVVAAPHPFKTARQFGVATPGQTLREILNAVQPDPVLRAHAVIAIGDHIVPRDRWDLVRPREGTRVTIRVVPHGGGGGKKNPLRTILTVVVAVAALALGPALGVSLFGPNVIAESTLFTVFGFEVTVGAVGSAIIGLTGTLLTSVIAPPPSGPALASLSSTTGSTLQESPTLFIQGARNRVNRFGVVPCCLGKFRATPPHAAQPYTELEGDDQFLRLLFTFGYGPITIADQKIGETELENFAGVETEFRRGYQTNQLSDQGNWEAGTSYSFGTGDVDTATNILTVTANGLSDDDPVVFYTDDTLPDPLIAGVVYYAKDAATNTLKIATEAGGAEIDIVDTGVGNHELHALNQANTFPSATTFGEKYTVSKAGTVDGITFFKNDTIIFNDLADVTTAAAWDQNGDQPHRLYSNDINQEAISIRLDEDFVTRSSQPEADELAIDLTFQQGLFHITSSGSRVKTSVTIQVEYQPSGSSSESWIALDDIVVESDSSSAVRRALRWEVPQGQYDIRLRRTDAESTDTRTRNGVTWTALKTIKSSAPLNLSGIATLAMRIKASDELNGVVDEYNAVVQSIVPNYDTGSGQWKMQPTSNPAALYRYVLQGSPNKRPAPDTQANITDLASWHSKNVAANREFNQVVDFPTSVRSLLQNIASVGRAGLARPDAKWSVAVDEVKSTVVQHFTPRNSWGYEGKIVFKDQPHALRVRFSNRLKSWELDEMIVYDDGYGESNATEFETLDLPGVTDPEQIWKDARFHMAQARLRPETHSFFADIEHLVCTRGDLIRFTHDIPFFGITSGRIKSVTINAGMIESITVDEICTMSGGSTYNVRIRSKNGTSILKDVTTSAGDQTTLTFSTPFAELGTNADPQAGDLFMFGETGEESIELIVHSIEPGSELTARLVCHAHAPAVHDSGVLPKTFTSLEVDTATDTISIADNPFFDGDEVQLTTTGGLPGGTSLLTTYYVLNRTTSTVQLALSAGGSAVDLTTGGSGTHTITRQIPSFVSNLTDKVSLSTPAIDLIRSDETVLIENGDGTFESRILITIARPSSAFTDIVGLEAAWRPKSTIDPNGNFIFTPVVDVNAGEISITGVEDQQTIEFKLRFALRDGSKGPFSDLTTHKVVGQSANPDDVIDLSATQNGALVTFKWPAVGNRDVGGYEIVFAPRGSFVYENATVVSSVTKGTLITNAAIPPGDWTIGIKAVDRVGNKSTNATTYDLVVVSSFDVIEQFDEHPRWIGSISQEGWTTPVGAAITDGKGNPIALNVRSGLRASAPWRNAGAAITDGQGRQILLRTETVVRHDVSGTLLPKSKDVGPVKRVRALLDGNGNQLTAGGEGIEVNTAAGIFDNIVDNAIDEAVYEARPLDGDFDDVGLRVRAQLGAKLGAGESGLADPQFYADFRSTAGDFENLRSWTVGTAPAQTRFVQSQIRLLTSTGLGVLSSFSPIIDAEDRTEAVSDITVPVGGVRVTFDQQFHNKPAVTVTPDGTQAVFGVKRNVDALGFDVIVFDAGANDVGGSIDYTATGV